MEQRTRFSDSAAIAPTRFPDTEVISDALHMTEAALHETSARPPPELNAQGRRLLTDLENLTATERRFLEEKNPDSLIQLIMQEGRLALKDLNHDLKSGQLQGIDKETAKQMTEQASNVVGDIQALSMELITSASFRNELLGLLECLALIAQEVTGMPVKELAERMTEPLRHVKEDMKAAQKRGDLKDTTKEKVQAVADVMKEAANDYREGERIPLDEEQMERLMERLRRVIMEISSHPKSRRLINGLFDVIDLFTTHFSEAAHTNAKVMKVSVQHNVHLTKLAAHLRVLLERFIDKNIVEKLLNHAHCLADSATKDPDVRQYFVDIKAFLVNSFDNPSRLEHRGEGEHEIRGIVQRGRQLFHEKREELRVHFMKVMKYAAKAVKSLMNDPYLGQLQSDISQFISDLVIDDSGNFVVTKDALHQLKVILVTSILERMTIPIPMITHEDEKMEFEISNLWLVLKDVIPDMIHLEFRENLDVDTRDLRGKGLSVVEENFIILHAVNMKYNIKDANIWWRRKKFPKSEDSGMLEMNMPGEGIALRIVLTMKLKDPKNQIFTVRSVDCDIDKIQLKLAGTKHDKIYNMFLTLAKASVKRRMQTAIEEKITEMIGLLNSEVARQVVQAGAMGQKKMFGAVGRKIEAVTGFSIAPQHAESIGHETVKSVPGKDGYVKETVRTVTPGGKVHMREREYKLSSKKGEV